MKFTKLLVALLLFVIPVSAAAGEKRELVLELLEVTQAKKNHDLLLESYIKQLSNNPATSSDQFKAYLLDAMSWDSLVEPMIKIYEESYSIEELKSINQFFSSQVGKSFIAKAPEVNQKISVVVTNNIQSALKHLQPEK